MDIATLQPEIDPEATVWTDEVIIRGIKSGLKIKVRSADHPDMKRLAHRLSGKSIVQGVRNKGADLDTVYETVGQSFSESALEQAIGVSVDWEWGIDENGEQFGIYTYEVDEDGEYVLDDNGKKVVVSVEVWDFTPENARKLFNGLPEAVEAANVKAAKVENFTKASSKPSRKRSTKTPATTRQTAKA
jgi:hypothetical protein